MLNCKNFHLLCIFLALFPFSLHIFCVQYILTRRNLAVQNKLHLKIQCTIFFSSTEMFLLVWRFETKMLAAVDPVGAKFLQLCYLLDMLCKILHFLHGFALFGMFLHVYSRFLHPFCVLICQTQRFVHANLLTLCNSGLVANIQ